MKLFAWILISCSYFIYSSFQSDPPTSDHSGNISTPYNQQNTALPTIHGVLPNTFAKYEKGLIILDVDKETTFEVFGDNLEKITKIAFTHTYGKHPNLCNATTASLNPDSRESSRLVFKNTFHVVGKHYICFRVNDSSNPIENYFYAFISQYDSGDSVLSFQVKGPMIPLWLQITLIIILCSLSGIFSGLNLGLMSLGKTELKIIELAGSETEKRYAKIIRPVRERGNFLLCSLLVGNVLVNNSLTVLLDDLIGNGIYAVILSTLGITILGEIVPQAACSRHGLAVGAHTIWLTKLFMLVTAPVSFPISLVLDRILGEELGAVYNRKKLKVLVQEQEQAGTVAKDEMNIITGALAMTTKTVEEVMTPLGDAFMISYKEVLDFNTMNEIFSHGFTRIPVYGDSREDIRAILNVKDLAFINVDHQVSVATICEFYNRSIIIVPNHTTLESMLKEFRQGKAHMAFVERLVTDDNVDPYRETIGLVTLEDVIEEIIQAEIVDETDLFMDNVNRQVRRLRKRDFRIFHNYKSQGSSGGIPISPQLKIAALRHMVSNISSFRDDNISLSILQSMLNFQGVILRINKSTDPHQPTVVFERNKWSNCFLLILQGMAEVQFSSEELHFEAGPFYVFGEVVLNKVNEMFDELLRLDDPQARSSLLASTARFMPEYTLRARTKLECIRISAEHYFLARLLTKTKITNRTSVEASDVPSWQTLDSVCDFFQTSWDEHVKELSKQTHMASMRLHNQFNGPNVPSSETGENGMELRKRCSVVSTKIPPHEILIPDETSRLLNNTSSPDSASTPTNVQIV